MGANASLYDKPPFTTCAAKVIAFALSDPVFGFLSWPLTVVSVTLEAVPFELRSLTWSSISFCFLRHFLSSSALAVSSFKHLRVAHAAPVLLSFEATLFRLALEINGDEVLTSGVASVSIVSACCF